jgi:hypothetical protein
MSMGKIDMCIVRIIRAAAVSVAVAVVARLYRPEIIIIQIKLFLKVICQTYISKVNKILGFQKNQLLHLKSKIDSTRNFSITLIFQTISSNNFPNFLFSLTFNGC